MNVTVPRDLADLVLEHISLSAGTDHRVAVRNVQLPIPFVAVTALRDDLPPP